MSPRDTALLAIDAAFWPHNPEMFRAAVFLLIAIDDETGQLLATQERLQEIRSTNVFKWKAEPRWPTPANLRQLREGGILEIETPEEGWVLVKFLAWPGNAVQR